MPDPEKHPDLHGNVPDSCPAVLLLVDVMNPLRFEGSEAFVARALEVARRIAELKAAAKRARIPAIYVNDNAGRWCSNVQQVLDACLSEDAPGRPLARLLVPEPADYIVLKPKHSGFYSTPLDTLLVYLRARRLILTGFSVERCLLFTANDGFLRDYELFVPRDCTAAIDDDDARAAFRILERVLGATTTPSDGIELARLARP